MSTDPITTPTAIYYPLFYIIDAIYAKSNKLIVMFRLYYILVVEEGV